MDLQPAWDSVADDYVVVLSVLVAELEAPFISNKRMQEVQKVLATTCGALGQYEQPNGRINENANEKSIGVKRKGRAGPSGCYFGGAAPPETLGNDGGRSGTATGAIGRGWRGLRSRA